MMPMSLTAYAKRRGVSPVAVSKAVARGRLSASVGRNDRDQPVILDPELADREWEANTRQRVDHAASEPAPRRRGDPIQPAEPGSGERVEPAADLPRARRVDLPDGVPHYLVSQAVRAQAAARREIAAADREELELARERGHLVDAAELKADFAAHISAAKSRLLSLPSSIAQEMPDLAERVVPVVDRVVREALEELAADGRRE